MSAKPLIQHSMTRADFVVGLYLRDLPAEAFLTRPVPGMNHLAWQLGHILSVERQLVEAVRPGSCPPYPEGFDARHGKETHESDDPADFLTKDEYLALWKAQRAATHAVLETLSEEELAQPNPDERSRGLCPTVGTVFNLTGLHPLLHAGQFVAVRRKEAMPIAF